MQDPRHDKLADILVNWSCRVKKGEIVYIEIKGIPTLELGKAIIRAVTKAGGVPFWFYNDESLIRQCLLTNNEEQIKGFAKFDRMSSISVSAAAIPQWPHITRSGMAPGSSGT